MVPETQIALRMRVIPLRGGSNAMRRWLARERQKAMKPRYVCTFVVETSFGRYTVGGTKV